MRIAFYAPLKAPDHPVPSGDREMARLIVAALRLAGHEVAILSTLRSFLAAPDAAPRAARTAAAAAEVERLAVEWTRTTTPDLVFAYHLYYKAPDCVALPLARRFGRPYVTAEASYAAKRRMGPWGGDQDQVVDAVRHAVVNLCFTANDRAGLTDLVGPERLADLPPFIDVAHFPSRPAGEPAPVHLVTVAMMRPGDKARSYAFLAAALSRLAGLDWRLSVVGDGPDRAVVEAAFHAVPRGRVRFLGALAGEAIGAALRAADLFVWPGFNEAFGLVYLEAEASGLPVVALQGEGTPSVIRHGETGLLTPPDLDAYAAAVAALIVDRPRRIALGTAAAAFVHRERSLPVAAARLETILSAALAFAPGGAA